MTASPTAARAPFATLDERITRALIALRQARTASRLSRTREAEQEVTRAEEHLDVLLDYRHSVRQRTAAPARPE